MGAKIIYTITERTPSLAYVVEVGGGAPMPIGTPGGFGGLRWIDAAHLVFERTSADFKRRTIYAADVGGAAPVIIHEDRDETFWSMPGDSGAAATPSPDGKFLAFVSDRDGWDHIYVVPSTGGTPVQVTTGKFEAWRPAWSRDSSRLAFDANEPDRPGVRHLGVVTINGDPSRGSVTMLTTGRGTNIAASWSADGTRLVYQHTDRRTPPTCSWSTPRRLPPQGGVSDSFPSSIDRSALVEPELIRYKGPDGQMVPAYMFLPKGLDKTKRHPAVVWIHGDGINQNYDGWHVQRNYAVYYSFHQYLLQQGYVVIAPDYRGSIGTGGPGVRVSTWTWGETTTRTRRWRANYLKTLPYVDGERIGVWGLSYGGFFTLIAVTDRPQFFRCGIDVAGVADYAIPTRIRITAPGRRAESERRNRIQRSMLRRRRCRTSTSSSVRCSSFTAHRTSTFPTSIPFD